MSFQIGDTIQNIQIETQTVGERITNDDIIASYAMVNAYFNSTYKMPTTQRQQDLLVFPGVIQYPKADDFIGWMQPQRPFGNISPWFTNTTQNELVHTADGGNMTSFMYDRENQFLLVALNGNQSTYGNTAGGGYNTGQIIINSCDTLTDNGTVAISGDGSNLILDTQIFVQGSASYRFSITDSGGTTTITFSGMNPQDLTQFFQQGQFFLSLECPNSNTSAISQVQVRIGSDNTGVTNYTQMVATQNYRGDSIKNSWCQVGFNPLDLTTMTVGSPDYTNPTYMQIVITNGVSGTSGIYRLDNIFAALPTYFQLPYYSKNNIKAQDGTYILAPTAISDTILCPDDANDAFYYKALEHMAIYNLKDQELGMHFSALLYPFENTLRLKYPNQEQKIKTAWFRSPRAF